MKSIKNMACCTLTVRLKYNTAAEIDDLAEELGCSVPAATRKAIEYGIRYHKNDIINEVWRITTMTFELYAIKDELAGTFGNIMVINPIVKERTFKWMTQEMEKSDCEDKRSITWASTTQKPA